LIAFRAGGRVAFAFGDGLFEHVFDLAVGAADIDFSNPNGIETFSPAPSTVPWQAILKGSQSLSPGLRGTSYPG